MSDTKSYRKVQMGSERALGQVFAGFFALVAVWPALFGGAVRIWPLPIAVAFLAAAYLAPAVLRPLNEVWFRLGLLLHKIVSPVVMGLMFFGAFTPTGIVMRLRGRDLLKLKRDPAAETYWVARTAPSPAPRSMAKQF